jgi:hypothetical protein
MVCGVLIVISILNVEIFGAFTCLGHKLIDGARNYVVIRSDHVTTYPPQKAAREIVCAAPDKCI